MSNIVVFFIVEWLSIYLQTQASTQKTSLHPPKTLSSVINLISHLSHALWVRVECMQHNYHFQVGCTRPTEEQRQQKKHVSLTSTDKFWYFLLSMEMSWAQGATNTYSFEHSKPIVKCLCYECELFFQAQHICSCEVDHFRFDFDLSTHHIAMSIIMKMHYIYNHNYLHYFFTVSIYRIPLWK